MTWIVSQDSSSPWGDIWGLVWGDFSEWIASGSASGSWVSISGAIGNWVSLNEAIGTWVGTQSATGTWIALSEVIDEAWGDIWGYTWGQGSWATQSVATGDWEAFGNAVTNWAAFNATIGTWVEKKPITAVSERWSTGLWGTMHWSGRVSAAWVEKKEASGSWIKVA